MTIKEAREIRNITQKEIAQYLNISDNNYAKYEKYIHKPNILIAIKIAEYLNVNIYEIFKPEYYVNYTISKTRTESGDCA